MVGGAPYNVYELVALVASMQKPTVSRGNGPRQKRDGGMERPSSPKAR
jgi:hypothetical protein